VAQGLPSEVIPDISVSDDEELQEQAEANTQDHSEEVEPDEDSSTGKLILAEEVQEGHISWAARKPVHLIITQIY
jgi:hypothetical protein